MTKFRFRCSAIVLAFLAQTAMAANNVTTFPKPAVRDAWADIATNTDLVDPGNSFTSAGWPQSSTPPARQYFNWALNFASNGIRYFSQRGIVDYDPLETYQVGAIVQSGNVIYRSITNNNIGNTPVSGSTNWGGIAVAGPVTISGAVNATTATFTGAIHAPSLLMTGGSGSGGNALIQPSNNAVVYSVLGAPLFGPGIEARWDASTVNRYLAFGFYGDAGVGPLTEVFRLQDAVTTWSPGSKVGIGSTPDSVFQVLSTSPAAGMRIGFSNTSANYFDADTQYFRNGAQTVTFESISSSGVQVGAPAGGYMGAGTINAILFDSGLKVSTSIANAQSSAVSTSESFTSASVAGLAPLASPGLTGNPTSPTAAPGTNTTQIATTAFVQAATQGSSSLTANGWEVSPSGKITEWGFFPGTGSSPQFVLFPKGFPHNVFSVVVTPAGAPESFDVVIQSNGGFQLNSGAGAPFYWQAIGN
jgi:hypothetical protein